MLSRIGINRVAGLALMAFIPAIILFSAAIDSIDTYEKEFSDC